MVLKQGSQVKKEVSTDFFSHLFFLFSVFSVSLVLCAAWSAWAGPKVYPAVESEDEVSGSVQTLMKQVPLMKKVQIMGKVRKPLLVMKKLGILEKKKASASQKFDPQKYDLVDPTQKDSLLRRLKLVEQLISSHGRAYDYRVYTNQQLEMIITGLESKKISKLEKSLEKPPETAVISSPVLTQEVPSTQEEPVAEEEQSELEAPLPPISTE